MLATGLLDIRPTREDAEDDPSSFYRLVEYLRKNCGLTLKRLGKMTGEASNNVDVTIWRKLENQTFTSKERLMATRAFFEDENLFAGQMRAKVAEIDDAIYYAFMNFAKIKQTSQDRTRARMVGTYRFWRPSVSYKGEYVFGKITFAEDPKSRALSATMVQQKKATPGDDGATEIFKGHLYRVSHQHMMILRDVVSNDLRVTFFTRSQEAFIGTDLNEKSPVKGKAMHVTWLDGYALGFDSGPFFTPLHLSLINNVDELAAIDERLDIVPGDDERMPPRVLTKLKGMGELRRL